MKNIKLMFHLIKKNFQNAKELKSAFITSIVGMALNNSAFIILWYNFGNIVGSLNGWDAIDIFGLYAFSTGSYGLVCSFFYGIMNIPRYISTANFDKYLLTPKNILLKVSTSEVSTSAIGDLVFGIVCFIIYAILSKFTILQLLISVLLIICTSVVFFSFSLICMSVSFYLMDGDNISQGLFGMFLTVSLYHGGAFTGILRIIFVYVMPALLLGVIPVEILKTMSLSNLLLIIILTIIWFGISILFFYKSLKKYESNNLFGFNG